MFRSLFAINAGQQKLKKKLADFSRNPRSSRGATMQRSMSDRERNRHLEAALNEHFGGRGKAAIRQIEDVIYIEIHASFSAEDERWVRDLCAQPKYEIGEATVRVGWGG
jgi:hypothetical protein